MNGVQSHDTPFARRMQRQLIAYRTQYQQSPGEDCWYDDLSDNLYPATRLAFIEYVHDHEMPLHDCIAHVRSSQAYAANLLFPLLTLAPDRVAAIFGSRLPVRLARLDAFSFEDRPDENRLGEWLSDQVRGRTTKETAVDVRLDGVTDRGEPVTLLLEVKFTEPTFSACGGFLSPNNFGPRRDACRSGRLLSERPAACYLHGANGLSPLRRRYLDLLPPRTAFRPGMFDAGCPFADLHQCLRLHALSRSLAAEGRRTFFGLVHHEGNEAIATQWRRYVQLLVPERRGDLFSITGRELVEASELQDLIEYHAGRYWLAGDGTGVESGGQNVGMEDC